MNLGENLIADKKQHEDKLYSKYSLPLALIAKAIPAKPSAPYFSINSVYHLDCGCTGDSCPIQQVQGTAS